MPPRRARTTAATGRMPLSLMSERSSLSRNSGLCQRTRACRSTRRRHRVCRLMSLVDMVLFMIFYEVASEASASPAPSSTSAPNVRWLHHAPARPSPLARTLSPPTPASPLASSPTEVSQPLLSPRTVTTRSDTDASSSTAATRRMTGPSLDVPMLNHKSSNASSVSVYSTQSGEERLMRVPPSLIMAAFSRPDPTQPVIAEYTPVTRLSTIDYDEPSRLSRISQTSSSSQTDGPIGYAR